MTLDPLMTTLMLGLYWSGSSVKAQMSAIFPATMAETKHADPVCSFGPPQHTKAVLQASLTIHAEQCIFSLVCVWTQGQAD